MRQVTRKGLITAAAASGVLAAVSGGYAHADSTAGGVAANSPGVLSGNTAQVPLHVPVNACGNSVNVVGALNPTFGNRCANVSGGGHAKPVGLPGQSGHHAPGHGHGAGHGPVHGRPGAPQGPVGSAAGGSSAGGYTANSPGVASGNTIQAPIDVPVNACGNSVNVVGVGNPAFGNTCVNDSAGGSPSTPEHPPHHPGQPHHPGHPGEPNHPGQPGNPGNEHPGNPGTPVTPEKPVQPVTHTPAKPGIPAQPVSHGTHPDTRAVSGIQHGTTEELAHTGAGPVGLALPLGAGMLLAGTVIYRRSRARASV
jgi:hypothetical protein